MSIMLSACLRRLGSRIMSDGAVSSCSQLRYTSSWIFPWMGGEQRVMPSSASGMFHLPPWHHQQVRHRKRGNEYQPNNIKRKRTHGWIKRISTRGGIEVLLRRMLKGRKSLSH